MVIDPSAIVAILFGEPEQNLFSTVIEWAPLRLVSEAEAVIGAFRQFGKARHPAGLDFSRTDLRAAVQ